MFNDDNTMATPAEYSFNKMLSDVQGMEPFESVFRNTLNDMKYGSTLAIRWQARREWMAFMREHVVEYLTRLPELREDLIEMLDWILERGIGRRSYLEDVAAVLAVARAHAME